MYKYVTLQDLPTFW